MTKTKQPKKEAKSTNITSVKKPRAKSTPVMRKPLIDVFKELFVFPKYDYKKDTVTVFAADPGIKNFGYVIIEASNNIVLRDEYLKEDITAFLNSIKIIDCGFLKSCITELRQDNIIPYVQQFHTDNENIFTYPVDYLVLERYQARDLRGPRNEIINFLICSTVHAFMQSKSTVSNARLLIPAQWKRYYTLDKTHQVKGLDLVYDSWKADKQLKRVHKLTDHQTDAFLIGVYFLLDLLFREKKDQPVVREQLVTALIESVADFFRVYFSENNKPLN